MSAVKRDPRTQVSFNAQVLVLLGLYLFGGGGGSGVPLTKRVKSVIDDKARAEEASHYAQGIDNANAATNNNAFELRSRIVAGLRQVPRDERALRAELQQRLEQSAASEWEVVELRFQLKDTMTRGEWAELFEKLRKDRVTLVSATSR